MLQKKKKKTKKKKKKNEKHKSSPLKALFNHIQFFLSDYFLQTFYFISKRSNYFFKNFLYYF